MTSAQHRKKKGSRNLFRGLFLGEKGSWNLFPTSRRPAEDPLHALLDTITSGLLWSGRSAIMEARLSLGCPSQEILS